MKLKIDKFSYVLLGAEVCQECPRDAFNTDANERHPWIMMRLNEADGREVS